MRAWFLFVLLLGGCAPINALTMSDKCRALYDACLNACPRPPPNFPPDKPNLQIEVASCTDDCNRRSSSCR